MAINSRAGGVRGELQVVDLLRKAGIPARRGQQYSGGGTSPDVVHALDPIIHIEVKFQNRLVIDEWFDQAAVDGEYRIPVVFHRKKAKAGHPAPPWTATTTIRDLASLSGDPEPDAYESGDEDEIRDLVAAELPWLGLDFMRSDALRFDRYFAEAVQRNRKPGIVPGLAHARRDADSLWMLSLLAEDFLEIAVQSAIERFDFVPAQRGEDGRAAHMEGQVEREYRRFWDLQRPKIAAMLPLFRSDSWAS